ncbi:hypothetical protein [Lentzea sp. CA-135723]|uniref:hypothetical protein n=1 Tax=Lentzea sp. CA-135723 TaxID=3239950 RepID=UPI003D9327ED
MTDPINPFMLPELDSPMQPLCPYEHPHHEDLYVQVDDSVAQYARFQAEMGSLASLVRNGRLALVTGDRGFGKSATVNRCAAWAARTLEARHGLTTAVIDVTSAVGRNEGLDVPTRLARTCDKFYDRVLYEGTPLLSAEGLAEFKESRTEPGRVYPNLGRWLLPGRALVLLLPSVELVREVVTYAGLLSPRVLFLFESQWIDKKDEASILASVGGFTMPVTLRLGTLADGDAGRYVSARLNQSDGRGRFPRMTEKTSSAAGEKVRSVAQLQRSLHSTYEFRRLRELRYENEEMVTIEDFDAADSHNVVHYESGTS